MKPRLTPKLAQNIVNRTMKILNRRINIRNRRGYIIASVDKDRINTRYKMAKKAIRKGKIVKITEEEAKDIPGAKPGIDLPIFYNDKIVGAVGIIGDPEELESYAGLVRMTVELMLQQAFNIEQLQLEEQAEEHFINELLNSDSELPENILRSRADAMGFNLDKKYTVCILEVVNFWDKMIERDTSSVRWQQYKKDIKKEIKKFFMDDSKVSYLEEKKFVILKLKEDDKDVAVKLESICNNMVKYLQKKFDFKCKIGIGMARRGIKGIRDSLSRSRETLYLGKLLNEDRNVYSCENMVLERMVNNLPVDFIKNLAHIFPLEDHYQESLEIYFANNLNISETARKLYLHRNTVVYRLKKIHEYTGLNPRLFDDAICLKLALLCYKYRQV